MNTLFLILLLLNTTLQAEVYRWTDRQGQVHFSDKPQVGAERLTITPGYTYYQVKKVYDGDTVLLTNGQKVRLLGVNTPEVETRYKPAEAGGEQAKTWLKEVLQNKKVRLETDVEKKDKYGRKLAYLFTEQGLNINLQLLNKGLATLNIHPPNVKYSAEFIQAQQQAENNQAGVWRLKQYAPIAVSDVVNASRKGWQRVYGRVETVHHGRKYSYLNFSSNFSAKIAHSNLVFFPKLESFIGHQFELRGWPKRSKNRYQMLLRHGSAIKPI